MKKLKNQMVRNYPEVEINSGKSETVPDQSMSVRTMIQKYTSGTLPPIHNRAQEYTEDLIDTRFMDINEQMELLKNQNDIIKQERTRSADLLKKNQAKLKELKEAGKNASSTDAPSTES